MVACVMTTIQIGPDQIQSLTHFETSVARWSIEHASLSLAAKRALDTVEALVTGRQQTIDKILSESGIDVGTVQSVSIDPATATLSVVLKPAPAVA